MLWTIVAVIASILVMYMVYMKLTDNFYPVVSREVANYRAKDKHYLGVLEPDFAAMNVEFAGHMDD